MGNLRWLRVRKWTLVENTVMDQGFIENNYFLIVVKFRWHKSNVLGI